MRKNQHEAQVKNRITTGKKLWQKKYKDTMGGAKLRTQYGHGNNQNKNHSKIIANKKRKTHRPPQNIFNNIHYAV